MPIARDGFDIRVSGVATTLERIEPETLLCLDRAVGATEGGRYTRFSDTGAMPLRGTTALRGETAIMLAGADVAAGDGEPRRDDCLPALLDLLLDDDRTPGLP